MMDNLAANKNNVPCQSWAGQNGWSTVSTQGSLFSPLPSSQHLSLDLSSSQRPSCDHLQASIHSCMSDISTLQSTQRTAMYETSHSSSSSSSISLFANTAIPSSSHGISFAQQNPHTSSMLLTTNRGKHVPPPSLPQTNQAPQPCRPQQLPLLSTQGHYKASFQPPFTDQGLPSGLQDLPISLPSCGQQHEQLDWIPSSHCRGAANKSVPDAAAHPNKEPSQERNITPPANNDIRRSVLLHQRAQLLEQLAELNKHLESIPPDDSSDGQTPHTVVQSQLQLSADCSSPASYDEQNEAFDTPEDPMSEAESVKKENTSSEDGSDHEYIPESNGDFSDFQSDSSSSDESSHSKPSTPTDERPSLPENRQDKSGDSLTEAKSVSLSICPTNLKKSSQTVVLPCKNTEEQRHYDRRNYCVFCSKPLSKMSRHLMQAHSDKKEVAAAFQYPVKSRERQKIWNRLINQGNFVHNKKVLKTGKGQLAVRKRPNYARQAIDFLHCLYCRGLYMKNALFRHMKLCPERVKNGNESGVGRKRIAVRCALEASDDLGITDGFKSILTKMTYNDVTQTVMDDKVLLQFGELLFNHYGSDEKKHEYIRQNLRQMARLVLEAQKITPLKKLEDFFLPSSFPHVVSAVNVLAGYDPASKTYRIPSLAIKIGYHLQKTCVIVKENAVKSGNESLAESAQNFLSVYQKKWNKLVSSGALSTLRETKSHTEKKVPLTQDVKLLSCHMEKVHLLAEKKLRESPSTENYAALAKVVLARTIIFNRRKASDVSSLKLKDFMSRKQSELHAGMEFSVSHLEKNMCGLFPRVDIRGSCGRMLPILLKPTFVSAMELLVEVRETCGVLSDNPFLFGRPQAMCYYNGSDCLQKYVKQCAVKDPEVLTVPKIRQHYATMVQLITLDENEAEQILGPNNQIRELRQNGSMQLEDIGIDFDEGLQPARGQQGGSWNRNQRPSAHHANSGKKCRKGTQMSGKHKWQEAEVLAVERHMMRFIKGHKVPQKDDCIQCLEAEPEALRTRSWRGVKDYVRNRITSLKHEKKCSFKGTEARTSKKTRKHETKTPQLMNLDGNGAGQNVGAENQVRQLWQTNCMQQDNTEMDCNERFTPARGQQAASWNHSQHAGAHYGQAEFHHEQAQGATTRASKSAPQKSANSRKKGPQNSGVHKWQEAEVLAVERHMMRFIKGHKVPQKDDCIECLEAEPEALRTRSWKGVKDYVRNRITSLKRQKGSSKATSTNRN
ncbi:uncharacterized protein LOC119019918 isoform X2 [Acanthopagrus latus]|uniref:uncharacterized protein LOC119019918 isoform X2 n=1 Tax=Acanthopagrus latus TaxID=8177 RepID=UPI00187C6883|nr:uncharacterized protein LOC119019918 isoform X2 [Acanthopagrus latus]